MENSDQSVRIYPDIGNETYTRGESSLAEALMAVFVALPFFAAGSGPSGGWRAHEAMA